MNLDFDDSKRMHYGVTKQERVKMLQRFIKRVDGKLALCKNVPLNRFSIKCKDDVGPAPVIGWITNVLKRRVSELALDISSCWDWPMSTAIDGCNTMVQEFWESCSVSSTSLKRLTYLKANFDSLVEARLDLQMTHDQIHKAKFSADDPIQHEGDECLCKPWEEENIPTCLSLSPVKVLKIMKFGDIDEDEDMDKMMDQVEYFLETMPNLEQLIIHYETSNDEDVEEVLSQFQMVPREGLTECRIQVISDNLVLSSI
ncbi:FBD domain [Arabidopsis suecica]|uniref:FBD domain n=1 Tax=Arabidopsis suecica TaxID=45249 RepID=A0A8T2FJ93_ARASU|nr:FBD domain [Arabidopsis suecica]